ncbi:DedA family protein [Buchnera aphidicola (Thelaxes californica)]|uniref:DedA family protein n=1 Tax=Buchnera aphidicola (Thelaxes californica) TaxID=1315998 RepID=A0A4D6YF30_9GAMM|nr:DedA family protein [Buchnera aphidicola]QCI26663.1 DedA family protein [Buchnera aphidicola (Thelaxes californica)]
MESWLIYLKSQPTGYSILIIGIISFAESLLIISFLFPSIVFMTAIGTLIGNRQLNLYSAWFGSTIGCLFGDWLSYYIGWKFKKWLNNLFLFQKYQTIFRLTKSALYQYSVLTILIGRFIGPTRPIISIISGMLQLPIKKFFLPNIVACILWPILYFLPGIVAGITINNPELIAKKDNFKILLIFIFLINIIGIWFFWRWWKAHKYQQLLFSLTVKTTFWISCILCLIGILGIILIQFHPKMYIFRTLLWKIFFSPTIQNHDETLNN